MSKYFVFGALTGGGTGALDAIDGTVITAGDIAVGADATDEYVYKCDASGDAESSPDCIAPDNNAGAKRWKRRHDNQKAYRAASPTNGHMASVDGDGDVVDSGKVSADVIQSKASTDLVVGNLVKAGAAKAIEDTGRAATDVDEFVDAGDTAAHDFAIGDLTLDGIANWRDLDLSAIVPANAKAVIFRVSVTSGAGAAEFRFRKNGNSNTINTFRIETANATSSAHGMGILGVGAGRILEYSGTAATFSAVNIAITGWIL